jgi:hypothetical protein
LPVQHACACALPVSPESFAGAFLDRSISYGAAMMILRSSPASPFGRKVRIAISLLGFDDQTRIEPADPTDFSDSLRRQNPLGKIPVLIAEDGTVYYDSRVIVDFLDERAGGSGSPRYGCRRYATAFSTLRSLPFTRRDGVRPNITSKNGSIIKPVRSPARWKSLNPIRRYSRPPRAACPISARSRSLARSVTVIFASAKAGATRIRALWHGWTLSLRAFRLSRRPSKLDNITFAPAARSFI